MSDERTPGRLLHDALCTHGLWTGRWDDLGAADRTALEKAAVEMTGVDWAARIKAAASQRPAAEPAPAAPALPEIPTGRAPVKLSRRQRQMLPLIARGMSNKQIAAALGVGDQTVKNYITGLLRALGVTDRTQAAIVALRSGWLEDAA